MKYLLIVLVVLAVIWLARSARRLPSDRRTPPTPPAKPGGQSIVACAQCGLHLPVDEALPGRGGVFCSEAHRTEYERVHPAP